MAAPAAARPAPWRILVADDEVEIGELLQEFLEQEGFACTLATNGFQAAELLEREDFDALVTDLRMPAMDGLELLDRVRQGSHPLPVLVMSAYADVAAAVAAMKAGAADYLAKPFEPEELKIRLLKAMRVSGLERELARGRDQARQEPASRSARMKQVLDLAARSAPTDAGILIRGESGTGKEVLARWIHQVSRRGAGNFVAINLGGIPEHLLESELFGHERGAFTGADRRKAGLFELADGGTLFLDEIGDMPLALQVKLLRVLQEKSIQRLGSTSPLALDLRIIAATHVNLEEATRAGRFREDLMYRLKVIELVLPPLRDRPEDIPALAGEFLRLHGQGQAVDLSPAALEALLAHPFPGNIRELENMIRRALILGSGPLLTEHDLGLPPVAAGAAGRFRLPAGSGNLGASPAPATAGPRTLAAIEEAAIRQALARNGWHRSHTAAELGINRRTLLNKLKEYGIEEP